MKFVEEKIVKKEAEICDLYKKLSQLVEEESNLVSKLPLKTVVAVSSSAESQEKPPESLQTVEEMSIYRGEASVQQSHGCDTLKHLCAKMGIPHHSAPENLLANLLDIHSNTRDDSMASEVLEERIKTTENLQTALDTVTEELGKIHKEQFEELLPGLAKCEQSIGNVANTYMRFNDAVQTWWTQPAQFAVPWEKVDGCNIEEFNRQFDKHGELLKQGKIK